MLWISFVFAIQYRTPKELLNELESGENFEDVCSDPNRQQIDADYKKLFDDELNNVVGREIAFQTSETKKPKLIFNPVIWSKTLSILCRIDENIFRSYDIIVKVMFYYQMALENALIIWYVGERVRTESKLRKEISNLRIGVKSIVVDIHKILQKLTNLDIVSDLISLFIRIYDVPNNKLPQTSYDLDSLKIENDDNEVPVELQIFGTDLMLSFSLYFNGVAVELSDGYSKLFMEKFYTLYNKILYSDTLERIQIKDKIKKLWQIVFDNLYYIVKKNFALKKKSLGFLQKFKEVIKKDGMRGQSIATFKKINQLKLEATLPEMPDVD
eukprot:NODE_281_length_10828_cov_0.749837.p5 type:complete len:327 gc:universal NODE_281_length_10828_cov_0.749837:5693-6673(+)